MSLYTDVQGNEFKAIEGKMIFKKWIKLTEQIYSISDTIYGDPVHSLGAWSMQKFWKGNYFTTAYAFGEEFDVGAVFADDPVSQTFM